MIILGAGSLAIGGTLFAVFLGVISSGLEHEREHELAERERARAGLAPSPVPSHEAPATDRSGGMTTAEA